MKLVLFHGFFHPTSQLRGFEGLEEYLFGLLIVLGGMFGVAVLTQGLSQLCPRLSSCQVCRDEVNLLLANQMKEPSKEGHLGQSRCRSRFLKSKRDKKKYYQVNNMKRNCHATNHTFILLLKKVNTKPRAKSVKSTNILSGHLL